MKIDMYEVLRVEGMENLLTRVDEKRTNRVLCVRGRTRHIRATPLKDREEMLRADHIIINLVVLLSGKRRGPEDVLRCPFGPGPVGPGVRNGRGPGGSP